MVDCGMFGKEGCALDYTDLFAAYRKMRANYGIIIDVFRDSEATVKSARKALEAYNQHKDDFKLVAVAQGKTVPDYLRCYEKLRKIGYKHIALGGLLRKRKNTVRYAHVRGGTTLESLLKQVRKEFDPEWLFVLGAFHEKRVELFQKYGVWGSDCKGWIFNYLTRDEVIPLIRRKTLERNCRIAVPDLKIGHVKAMTEQELRFKLTRGHIEERVLGAVNGKTREDG
jgi:hypothetical protein